MKELWEQAIIYYNLPLTILLGFVVVFWLLSLLGTVDLDTLDIDLNTEVNADADVDVNGSDGAADGFFGSLLRFVNAQDVPVMVILSLLTLLMWGIGILGNFYLNPGESGLLALGFLFINFIISVLLVKAITEPLRPFMRAIKNDQEHQEPLVGLSGTVKSRSLDSDFGQVEVPRDKGAPALLNAILPEGRETLQRGDRILVIDFDKERDKYLVHPAQSETENSQ